MNRKICDQLFSKLVRRRGVCQYDDCGLTTTLECAHVIGRSNMRLRYDERNALCLCHNHHVNFWHKSPEAAFRWFEKEFSIEYTYLMAVRNDIIKKSFREITEELEEALAKPFVYKKAS